MSSDEPQILIPPSFLALYLAPGRLKPSAPHGEILARYEFCEDLALMLTDHATTKRWELGVAEDDVLQRIHQGLAGGQAGVSPAEARWVVCRLAELLNWATSAFAADAPPE